MKRIFLTTLMAATTLRIAAVIVADELAQPIASPELVLREVNGVVAVEAEHYFKQTATDKRAWYLTTAAHQFKASNDADPAHVAGASGGAYLEILPDTRHNHGHRLIRGENFSPEPGLLGVLHYRVHFDNPGRYYVWVRAHSTGSEDNGIHVGLNGQWPESGQRMQWCQGKRTWRWEAKQRTEENHCGEPHKIYLDIPSRGEHVVQFSMREDGFEFDKFFLTQDRELVRPEGEEPVSVVKAGKLPAAFPVSSTSGSDR